MLRPCSEQHREGCSKPRLPLGCRPPAYKGGRLVAGRGVECPLSAPGLGNAAAPSHFPLGPLLAFQAAAFSIVNLETENKPVGRGGSGEVTGAAARWELAAAKSRPHKPRPQRTPPLPLCPAQAEIWGPVALTLERVEFPMAESSSGPKTEPGRSPQESPPRTYSSLEELRPVSASCVPR